MKIELDTNKLTSWIKIHPAVKYSIVTLLIIAATVGLWTGLVVAFKAVGLIAGADLNGTGVFISCGILSAVVAISNLCVYDTNRGR